MINLIVSSISNAYLMRFLSAQNSAFVGYEQDLSELIQGYEKFQNLVKIGEIEYKNTDKLLVFTCKYLGELTSRSSRKNQYEIAKKALKEDFKDGAVFVFYDDAGRFRFSFIRRNFGDKTNKFTPWKRYTYFVEPDAQTNRTFIERIGSCTFESLDAIQEAFSVEKLTKDFYKELSNWYFWAIKNVSFPNNINDDTDDEKYNSENIIRLITRLIFVWFLKQKNLVKPELFQVEALTGILKEFEPESDSHHQYYRAILQNLFFATLNQEIGHRRFAEDKGYLENRKTYSIKSLYRYENEFKKGTTQALELFSEIPFLNGGLFECLDNKQRDGKVFDWDGFSRTPKHQAKIPNSLFFAKEKLVDLSGEYNDKKMKSVKVSGIIEILSRYNFTIEENTPVEIEVALDPELLGKVFENLLGAFNPETQETARKQTGSFYTPREIVHYMVDESLVSYYKTKVPEVDEGTLRLLLSYDEQNVALSEQQKEKLIQATFDCKILDPACGSGAFPMGVLQQMVHLLNKLDSDDNTNWNNVVMAQAMSDFEKANKLGDEDFNVYKEAIEKTFENGLNYPDYARKLHLIENCIYGIDIQTIAVQISKLRFFISLVCEQRKNDDASKNFGIRPLPNLETKFVAANTLIGIEKTEEDMALFNEDRIKQLIDKLQHIRHRQFLVTNVREKKILREKDQEIRVEIENEISKLFVKHADELLDTYKENLRKATIELGLLNKLPENIKTHTSTDLFGQQSTTTHNLTESKRKELKKWINRLEEKISGGSDYSRLSTVVALAKQLTSWNPYDQNQSSPFFDSEWMFGLKKVDDGYFDITIGNPPYGIVKSSNTDKDILDKLKKYYVADFKINLFALFIERCLIISKCNGVNSFIIPDSSLNLPAFRKLREYIINNAGLTYISHYSNNVFETAQVGKSVVLQYVKNSKMGFYDFRTFYNNVSFSQEQISIDMILKDNGLKFIYKTNADDQLLNKLKNTQTNLSLFCDVFDGINPGSEYIKNELITSTLIDNYSKRIIDGKCFTKYSEIKWDNYYIYYKEDYVNKLREKIESAGGSFTARIIKKTNFFEKPKILTRQTADSIIGTIDYNSYYVKNSVHSTLIKNEYKNSISLELILAFLNSKLIDWLYRTESLESGRLFPQVKIERLRNLPIIIPSSDVILLIEKIIKDIFSLSINDVDYLDLQNKIDILIFRIFKLSYSEVNLIDPDIASIITEAGYYAVEI